MWFGIVTAVKVCVPLGMRVSQTCTLRRSFVIYSKVFSDAFKRFNQRRCDDGCVLGFCAV
jgi:hypothetical protein